MFKKSKTYPILRSWPKKEFKKSLNYLRNSSTRAKEIEGG